MRYACKNVATALLPVAWWKTSILGENAFCTASMSVIVVVMITIHGAAVKMPMAIVILL